MNDNNLSTFSNKEIQDLLEKAAPLLSEEEIQDIKDALAWAKTHNDRWLRSYIGGWLTAVVADGGDVPPFKTHHGTP